MEEIGNLEGAYDLCLLPCIRKIKLKRLIGRARSMQVKEGMLAVL
jgi:hypothetical protein